MKKRVVVTGIGAITPIGNTVSDFWSNAKSGMCGIDYIKSFNTENSKVKIAAEIKGFDPMDFFSRKQANRLDRFSQIGVVAAREAYCNAGLDKADIDKNRLGVSMGNGVGGIITIVEETQKLLNGGMNMVSPLLIPKSLPNILSGNISIEFEAKGISNTVVTACAAGTNSIGEAFRAIQYEDADIMISGASEACITPLMIAGFTNLNALSLKNDISRASIPFDMERDGFVIGEGAGILILEELEHALKRGARIYCELAGYGFTSDAYHLTSPAPEGEGAARAMNLAIENAGIEPKDISYINAHGTSTHYNDKFETQAVKTVFKEHAYKIPISSTKSMIGHLLGASGAVEAISCIKALEENYIHGTTGYKVKDGECDLDYTVSEGRSLDVQYTLSNSFGFGGHNASVIFKKW
ncbi:3-oxoacyl-[acyl-carrier-protein] synthase II [Peptoclostridium litorale DSM 5388]|uniref:3-oxoacyl-[acyl-carrier-protein] synthase 2 n=1 Tax=Peptoclostridium litorale DSM 5388 TaxID=1121324 RepID=A0A069RIP4_PEPLI|nr:beta-ketoacyl-ACP synthase II [Peptoclostridium litorale]KDR96638.1 3-oxoacyl-[acyl-carrier-protein] synthase 2 [Peptoclostridium litorale DSM 5388]SIN68198.1 3-oxoacyl-[acyl-carrier-protein] synthase II [Peptoclostridium litorale DSM 5388]